MTGRVAVVPPVPALLPEHAGLVDPVPELRAACDAAVAELVAGAAGVVVLHDPLGPGDRARGVAEPVGARVGRALLARAGWEGETRYGTPAGTISPDGEASVLVLASGSARRGDKAPGHLDERSFAFDDEVGRALASGDPVSLAGLDADLGDELLAAGVRCLQRVAAWLEAPDGAAPPTDGGPRAGGVRWAGDPYGVQYWVAVLGSGARATD